jgi:transposase-like protein
MSTPHTLQQAILYFSDSDRCFKFAVELRWPNGVVSCPRCGSEKHSFVQTRKLWHCKGCKKQFTLKVGTILEDSPITLDKWMVAMWMLANCKNGVSSYEVHRAIGVTQKTAWFILHRIRVAMADQTGLIGGGSAPVECDETFVGGNVQKMHKRKRIEVNARGGNKTIVFGMLERGGRVKARVIADRKKQQIQPAMAEAIVPGANIITDEFSTYSFASNAYNREVVNHAIEYANGHIHTNGIENFWSLLKRGLKGTYVAVEPFHLDAYVAEQVFRYNNRKDSDDSTRFMTVMSSVAGKRLTYDQLTGAARPH